METRQNWTNDHEQDDNSIQLQQSSPQGEYARTLYSSDTPEYVKNWFDLHQNGKFAVLKPYFAGMSGAEIFLLSRDDIIVIVQSSEKALAVLFYRLIHQPLSSTQVTDVRISSNYPSTEDTRLSSNELSTEGVKIPYNKSAIEDVILQDNLKGNLQWQKSINFGVSVSTLILMAIVGIAARNLNANLTNKVMGAYSLTGSILGILISAAFFRDSGKILILGGGLIALHFLGGAVGIWSTLVGIWGFIPILGKAEFILETIECLIWIFAVRFMIQIKTGASQFLNQKAPEEKKPLGTLVLELFCFALFIIIASLSIKARLGIMYDNQIINISNALAALAITGSVLGGITILFRIISGSKYSDFIVLGVVQFFMSSSAAAWANIIYVWEGPQIPYYLALFSLEIIIIFFWMVLGLQIAKI